MLGTHLKFSVLSEMLFVWFLVLYCIYFLAPRSTCLPFYHQDDYDMKIERIQLVAYNKSYVRDFKVENGWYNRTLRAFNITGHLLVNFVGNNFVGEMHSYKFRSNEYRFFPATLAYNICEEFANNNFNVLNLLKNISNMHGCPLKKGFYYAYKFVPDFSLLPPFIPYGRYKTATQILYNNNFMAEVDVYFEIKEKPLKWN